jgi:hypothetical protein
VIAPPLAVRRVLPVLRGILAGDAFLVARLGTAPIAMGGGPGIYTAGHVPADARPDYLVIGPFTERSTPTMGEGQRWGSELTTPIKLVAATPDIAYCQVTIERVLVLLHAVRLTVPDYARGMALLDTIVDSYTELLAGVQYWHYPMLWNVSVHQ